MVREFLALPLNTAKARVSHFGWSLPQQRPPVQMYCREGMGVLAVRLERSKFSAALQESGGVMYVCMYVCMYRATRGVTVSMSAFLACHQCYCAGSSLGWGLNLNYMAFSEARRQGFSPGTPVSCPPSSV